MRGGWGLSSSASHVVVALSKLVVLAFIIIIMFCNDFVFHSYAPAPLRSYKQKMCFLVADNSRTVVILTYATMPCPSSCHVHVCTA